ncbi:MAG: hypothetical protein HPZ91_06490 [Lentisphaeria bacterium]|nr:hypothetical protein [Lentisphaeria bacterium]
MKTHLSTLFAALLLAAPLCAAPLRPWQAVRFNPAEAVFEPFWDGELSELDQWRLDAQASDAKVRQEWDTVSLSWAAPSPEGRAFTLRREGELDVSGFDRLILCAAFSSDARVILTAETDRGPRRVESQPFGARKQELELPLDGASKVTSLTLDLRAARPGTGWISWIGLQNSRLLEEMLQNSSTHPVNLDKYLKGKEFKPSFRPAYGLLFNEEELELLRAEHARLLKRDGKSPFLACGAEAAKLRPETLVNDYVNFFGDTRYCRVRDFGKRLLNHGLNAAVAGHLNRDPELLRLAARYAMAITLCRNWDDAFLCRFPGSTFEHRAFVQSLCSLEVAALLDLAGEFLTPHAKTLALRKLAQEGVGSIQYVTWRWDYIFDCNQLSWFSSGRMLALAVLEKEWGNSGTSPERLRPYREQALKEIHDNLNRTILADGGYAEGPTYFRCVGRDAGLALSFYSRLTGKPLAEVIPPVMRRCDDFGEALSSTADRQEVISFADGVDFNGAHELISEAVMAEINPRGPWTRMVRKNFRNNREWPTLKPASSVPNMLDAALAWRIALALPRESDPSPPLVRLPAMNLAASTRRLNGETVKLAVFGNVPRAGHNHEDKGSFVLEYAGQVFAMDPGSCDYSNPLVHELRRAERHNMLLPAGVPERPAPKNPCPVNIPVEASGDARSFRAAIEPGAAWPDYFRSWKRSFVSESPDELIITDTYELKRGEGVRFLWQTVLPVTADGSIATIRGRRGIVRLHAPEGCTVNVEKLPLAQGEQSRICIEKPARQGSLSVKVRLLPLPDAE